MALSFSANLLTDVYDTIQGDTATVTRSGNTGTRIDSAGLLEVINANLPRFYYDAGVLLGVAAEDNRTNEAQYSEDMSNAVWVKSSTQVNATSTTDPYGNASTTIEVEATGANGTLLQTVTHAAANWAFSVMLKRVSGSGTVEVTVNGGTAWIDVTSTLTSDWKSNVYFQHGANVTNPQFGIRIVTSGDKVAMCCAQLEETLTLGASTYIPNLAASTATRNEDQINFGDETVWGNSGGTCYLELTPFGDNDPGADSNAASVLLNVVSTGLRGLTVDNNGNSIRSYDGTTSDTGVAFTRAAFSTIRSGMRWTGSNSQISVDGSNSTQVSFDGDWNHTVGHFRIGGDTNGGETPNLCIKRVRVWDEDIGITLLNKYTLEGLPSDAGGYIFNFG